MIPPQTRQTPVAPPGTVPGAPATAERYTPEMRRAPGRPTMPSTTGSSAPALERVTAAAGPVAPLQPLFHLDALWIQVAGTLCNLACTHCFVTSGPGDDHHALMPRDEVRNHVARGLALGAKEFYFTGGEPFVHPAMLEII